MGKRVKRILAVLLSTVLMVGMLPAIVLAADSGTDIATSSPLTVEITTKRNFYTPLSAIQFTATITNTSEEDVKNVSAEALFGADLSPLESGKGKTFEEKATLKPGESITLTYKAQPANLKSLDKYLNVFMLLRNLLRGEEPVAATPNDNGFDDGRTAIQATKNVKLLSFFATNYDIKSTVKVYFGDLPTTPDPDPTPTPDPDPTPTPDPDPTPTPDPDPTPTPDPDPTPTPDPDPTPEPEPEPEPEPTPEPTPSPTADFGTIDSEVQVLTQEQSEDFINNADPVSIDENGQMTVLVPDGVTYEEGEIFMVRPTAENPLGITGKVVSVEGNELVVVQPDIEEVFSELEVDLEKELTAADIIDEESLLTPIPQVLGASQSLFAPQTLQPVAAPLASFGFSKVWDLNYTLYQSPTGSVTLGGRLGFSKVDVSLNADIDIKNLKQAKISANAKMNLYADVNLRAAGNFQVGLKSKDPILSKGLDTFLGKFTLGGIYTENKIPLVRIIFDVGTMSFQTDVGGAWAPTMLAASLELTTTLGGKIEGHFELGASYECYVEGGFAFANEKFSASGKITPAKAPTVYVDAGGHLEAEARVGIDVAFYVLGCKLAAVTNDLALLGNADFALDMSTAHQDDFSGSGNIALKLLGAAQFALKAKWTTNLLGDITIVDLNKVASLYDVTLWSKDIGVKMQIADFNGHTYAVFNQTIPWTEAQAFCESIGGQLVTINSAEEQEYVEGLLDGFKREFYWIGASAGTDGLFSWVTGEPFDYTKWEENEPNQAYEGSEGFVGIWKKSTNPNWVWTPGTWNDFLNDPIDDPNITGGYGFICEWDT